MSGVLKRRVYKYGTGHDIPPDGVYLCTQVETLEEKGMMGTYTKNVLVWHYYEVQVSTVVPDLDKGKL